MSFLVALAGCALVGPSPGPPPARPRAAPVRARLTPAEIAQRSNPSIVVVEHDEASGTGFVVASDGRVVTNLHVIEGAREIRVVFPDGRKFNVTDVWIAETGIDLAVLRIDAKGLAPLPLGDSRSVHAGDHVVAIGNPRDLDHTVSDGLVGAIRDGHSAHPRLQISAPISPGSSGGPLFNDFGDVIGITTSMRLDAQNLNFAVPTSELEALLKKNVAPLPIAELRVTGAARHDARPCNARRANAQDCDDQCRQGDAESCTELGYMFRRARGVQRDDARAAELYKRGCEGGDAVGCSNLAVLYRSGEGVGRDPRRALELYGSSCERGNAQGCWGLGQMHLAGEGVARSAARASQLFERACDARLGEACIEAAEMFERGAGRPPRPRLDRAAAFYQRACDAGTARGCAKLGIFLAEGRGVARDEARAVVLFRRGCEDRDVESCAQLGRALVDGRGVVADRAQGAEVLRAACRRGSGSSCDRLQALGEKP